jgi:hypothetical protein
MVGEFSTRMLEDQTLRAAACRDEEPLPDSLVPTRVRKSQRRAPILGVIDPMLKGPPICQIWLSGK